MKKNKYIILVLLTSLLLSMFTGCVIQDGSNVQEGIQKNVENMIISDVPQPAKDENKELIDELEELEAIQVYFIDVGQADSALIITPNKDAILIDAGEKGDAEKILSQIKETGVEDLDLVIASHPHADHIGGMQEVIENYDAVEIIMSSHITNTKTFESLLDSIEGQGKSITQAKPNLVRDIDGVKVEIIASDIIPNDTNNSSILLRVDYGDISILFTGDLEEKAEKIVLEDIDNSKLSVDILKYGHHGSETSGSDLFLDKVSPKVSVISVGQGNKYNHPSSITIDKLMNKGINFYRTDEEGTIKFEIDGTDIITVLSNNEEQMLPLVSTYGRHLIRTDMVNSDKDSDDIIAQVSIVEEVYLVEDSNNFHRKDCEMLNGSTKTLSKIDAELKGLKPCDICFNK